MSHCQVFSELSFSQRVTRLFFLYKKSQTTQLLLLFNLNKMLSCFNAFVEFMEARSIYQHKGRNTRVAMRWILFKPIFCGDKFSKCVFV